MMKPIFIILLSLTLVGCLQKRKPVAAQKSPQEMFLQAQVIAKENAPVEAEKPKKPIITPDMIVGSNQTADKKTLPGLDKWRQAQMKNAMSPPNLDASKPVMLNAVEKFDIASKQYMMEREEKTPKIVVASKNDDVFAMRSSISAFKKNEGAKEYVMRFKPAQDDIMPFDSVKLMDIANQKPITVKITYGSDPQRKGFDMLKGLQNRTKIITSYLPKSAIITETYAPDMEANSVKIEF